jgi:hypothetical protein
VDLRNKACHKPGVAFPLLFSRVIPDSGSYPAFELGEGAVGDLRYPAEDLLVRHERGGELDDGILLVLEAADQAPPSNSFLASNPLKFS